MNTGHFMFMKVQTNKQRTVNTTFAIGGVSCRAPQSLRLCVFHKAHESRKYDKSLPTFSVSVLDPLNYLRVTTPQNNQPVICVFCFDI